MKNWVHYVSGSWERHYDGPPSAPQVPSSAPKAATPDEYRWVWHEQGVSYFDPETVISVHDNTEPVATIIATSDGKQIITRQRSATEVIADLQSALKN